jgi:hypothetical protein
MIGRNAQTVPNTQMPESIRALKTPGRRQRIPSIEYAIVKER